MWAKPKAVLARERAQVGADQPLPDEGLEDAGDLRLLLGRGQVGDGAPPEHLADHGRTLQHRPLERLEPVEPRGEHGLDGLGHADRLHVGQRLQAPVALDEHAVLDEHPQHLLEEERVAAGCAPDRIGGVLVERAGEVLEQLPRVVGLQRRQLDRRRSRPRRPHLGEVAAGKAADEDRRVAASSRRGTRSGRGTPAPPTGRRPARAAPAARGRASRAAAGTPSRARRCASAARRGRRPRAVGRAPSRRRARPDRTSSRSSRRTISTSGQ